MMTKANDEVVQTISMHTVGFMKEHPLPSGREYLPSGSGVLATIGGIRGIITAAHVVHELAGHNVGLLTHRPTTRRVHPLEFRWSDTYNVVLGGRDGSPDGPDLAFVRVPPIVETRLVNEHLFYSFDARLRSMREGDDADALPWEMVAGVIEKNSQFGEPANDRRVDSHFTSFIYGLSSNPRSGAEGLDLFDFTPAHGENVRRPTTYGGLSGSAVWAVGDTATYTDRILKGIVFHETQADTDGHRNLVCHGSQCIYRDLPEAIRRRFPAEYTVDGQ